MLVSVQLHAVLRVPAHKWCLNEFLPQCWALIFPQWLLVFAEGWLGCEISVKSSQREECFQRAQAAPFQQEPVPRPIPEPSHSKMQKPKKCRIARKQSLHSHPLTPLWNSSDLISKATISTSLSAPKAQNRNSNTPKSGSQTFSLSPVLCQDSPALQGCHHTFATCLSPRICFANELLELIKENRLFLPDGALDGFLQPGANLSLQNPQILALSKAQTQSSQRPPGLPALNRDRAAPVPTSGLRPPGQAELLVTPIRFSPLQEMLNFRRKCFDLPKHTTVGVNTSHCSTALPLLTGRAE